MGDYPDWTDIIQIVGSDIMMPMDLQAAYIMMPIDIQAQYINLAIDIVAQTVGNIEVDLVAQTIGNIEVDIAAQAIGNIVIDIEAQSVGIYLQPDWNTLGGTSKGYGVTGENLAVGGSANVAYEVPAGKTLFITQISCYAYAYDAANRDLNQACAIGIGSSVVGGMGGCQVILPTPLKFLTTETVTLYFFNRANHTQNYYASWRGYEI